MVMQSTQHTTPANRTTCFLSLPGPWNSLLNPLMWSLTVEESDVLLQNRLDLSPADQQKIVQSLSSRNVY
jgi:hypothetical protein